MVFLQNDSIATYSMLSKNNNYGAVILEHIRKMGRQTRPCHEKCL
jgi:hypothetical protein